MAVQDDVQRVAGTLARPGRNYRTGLGRARLAIAGCSPEAARQIEVFADRIADLTLDELRELHDETFRADDRHAAVRIVDRLAAHGADGGEAPVALDTLALLLAALEVDRNPYACLVKALCCALFARAAGHVSSDHRTLGSSGRSTRP